MNDQTSDLNGGFSLADLADIDVSDIEEIRFVAIPAGVYDFEITKADLAEDEKDGERRFKAEIEMKIVEAHAVLEPNVDRESLAGKLHTERYFIKPAAAQEEVLKAIGRIRAFVSDVGMDSAGKLGDIVRNLKGHTFKAQLTKRKDKNDPSREYSSLKLEQRKKA